MSNDTIEQAILSVQGISKSFGAQPVLSEVSMTVHEGDRLGLIGRNGSGKSTLMKIMAGLEEPDSGLVTRRQGLRVTMLRQQSVLGDGHTVADALAKAQQEIRELLREYEGIVEELHRVPADSPALRAKSARVEELEHHLHIADAWNLDKDVKEVSVALGLPGPERRLDSLSGGELRRVDLAVAIIRRPDVLLLDEPTNQIDAESAEWIESFLERYPGSCVLITHDRYFLDRVVNRIVELEHSHLVGYSGNYGEFLDYKTTREMIEARTEANRQATLRRELAWLQRGAKARSTKQKARIKRYDDLDAQGPPLRHSEFDFEIPKPNRLSKRILEADRIAYRYEEEDLFKDFSCIMQKDMRVGIIGPNGCGKSTLLQVLMGQVEVRSGKIFTGEATEFLYVDQQHEEVDPDMSILKYVANGAREITVNDRRVYVPAYLERFLFDTKVLNMAMQYLSGGERNRVDLAKKFLQGGNFLVLDEPTNDLDLPTLRVIEEAILSFEGCALIVSHDRYFLNRVCTHIWSFEGGGEVLQIAGNYDDYLRYRRDMEQERAREARAESAKVAVERPKKDTGQRRLSWHEKKELEGIEEGIAQAEGEAERLQGEINKPGFYSQDAEAVRSVLAEYEAAEQKIETLYTRWEELDKIARGD